MLQKENNKITRRDDSKVMMKWDPNENFGSIAFVTDDAKFIDKAKQINFRYITFDGHKDIQDPITGEVLGAVFINFKSMPKRILKTIYEHINDEASISKMHNKDCVDILDEIICLFNSFKLNPAIKKDIRKDISYIVMLIKLKEKDIDLDEYISYSNENKDFKMQIIIKDKKINPLHTHKRLLKSISLYEEDLKNIDNTIFLVNKMMFDRGHKNIFELCDILQSKNKILLEKIEYYKFLFDNKEDLDSQELINTNTIDLNLVDTYIIDNSIIPIIDIKERNNLDEFECYVNIEFAKRINLDEIKKYL